MRSFSLLYFNLGETEVAHGVDLCDTFMFTLAIVEDLCCYARLRRAECAHGGYRGQRTSGLVQRIRNPGYLGQ